MHALHAEHRVEQGSNGRCCQQFLLWVKTMRGLFSVKSQTVHKAGQCISGPLRSLFILSGKDPQTNGHAEHLDYTCGAENQTDCSVSINALR